MSKEPINWEGIPHDTWATTGNGKLARKYETSRQLVAYHRERLNMPDSPDEPGGDRITHEGKAAEPTTAVINCKKGQKRRWLQAREKAAPRKSWDAWAAEVLDNAAAEILND